MSGVRREVGLCFCGCVVPAAEARAVLGFIVDVVAVEDVDVDVAILGKPAVAPPCVNYQHVLLRKGADSGRDKEKEGSNRGKAV